uniref:Large ribosomal subunit protein uL4c n=1 Tax=Pterothamnion crispum TaxID=1550583 RepID=A0A4D6WXB3_9FLOR|nr:ribosomal protein L4 [Pterothamnion crispum]
MTEIKTLAYSIIDITQPTNKEKSDNIYFNISDDMKKNMYIIHRVIKEQLNTNRHGNAHTKTRSEVRGGGRKPWKQKGTGKARAGSIRSPLWRGGGVIFGPKSKKYISKINKKEKQLAIKILLYNKYCNTIVAKNLCNNLEIPSTKKVINTLKNLGINTKNREKVLIIVKSKPKSLYLSTRNLLNINIICANHINTLSLIKADKIVLTNEALQTIEKIYNDTTSN